MTNSTQNQNLPQEQTPSTVDTLRQKIADAAQSGVVSTSVDGVSVTLMNASETAKALEEVKKSEVKRFPFMMSKWK